MLSKKKHSLQSRQSGRPSRLLLTWAYKLVGSQPTLDAGSGSGRNALALVRLGAKVVCVDKDWRRLGELSASALQSSLSDRISTVQADVSASRWPFAEGAFGGIICIHFLDIGLLPLMHQSLQTGGHLYIETVGGQGQNHLELPPAGALRSLLAPHFHLDFYKERRLGPPAAGKCAVKLLARKTD